MPFDGGGTFNRVHNFSADASAGIQAQATRFDAELDGMATGLENCQTLTGETTPTANSPMGGFKHTGVAAATSTDNYLRADQSSNQVGIYVRDTNTGVTGVMSASAAVFPTAFTDGQRVTVKVSADGSAVAPRAIVINGLSANIIDNRGSALPASKMEKDGIFELVYDVSASAFRSITPRNDVNLAAESSVAANTSSVAVLIARVVAAEKAVTENRNSDTVISADASLTVALTTGTWDINLHAYFQAASATGMGLKYLLSYPGAFTASRFSEVGMVNGGAFVGSTTISATTEHTTIIALGGDLDFIKIEGTIVSASIDSLTFEWAQASSNADNLAMNNASTLVANKIV